MKNIPDQIQDAKEKMPNVTPNPPGLKAQSSAHDLKARLEWGEPALTILDVRERAAYNQGHIMGAMPFSKEDLVERAKSSLEPSRDIYVYGASDAETAEAANMLRSAGFTNVAELRGGLDAWRAIAGSTEGIEDSKDPAPKEAYNVASNLKHHAETQSNDL